MINSSSLRHGFVLQTNDPDEAVALLSDSAIPYTSQLMPGSPAFSTEIFVTDGQRIGLSRVVTTGAMRVEACLPGDAYALVLDLRNGVGLHHVHGESIEVDSDCAFLQSPLDSVEVFTPPNFEALFLRFRRDAFVSELQKMMDRELGTDLVFSPALRLQSAAGYRVRELCGSLRRILYSTDRRGVTTSVPLCQLENELISLLLQTQPHNFTRLLNRRHDSASRQIDAAEQFIRSNAHLPISLGDICKAAGVNARTLQYSFRKKRSCTPMEFLRSIRMEQVRGSLLQPSETTSVSGEASRWGFLHFGRFSSEYRRAYGELPSETLRRRRKKTASR